MTHLKSLFVAVGLLTVFAPARVLSAPFLNKSEAKWIGDLKSDKPDVRRSAAFALGKIGSEGNLPQLVAVLRDDRDAGVRDAAAAAIGDVIHASRDRKAHWGKTAPALLTALKDGPPKVKRSAAYAIGAFGADAADAVPDLKTALSDASSIVRQNAAWALGRVGKEAGEGTVDLLCDRLRDDDALVRRDAATALGDIGLPTAAKAWKPLLELVRSEATKAEPDDVLLRTALGRLTILLDTQNKQIVEAVMPLMNANNPEEVQKRLRDAITPVLKNLGGIGLPDAKAVREEALKEFRTALQGGNLDPVLAALKTLEEAGKRENQKLADQVKPLTQVLENEDPETAMLAAFALARIGGPSALRAVPVLKRTLNDPDPKLQEQAATFLGEMGPDAVEATAALAEAIRPERAGAVRARAAIALTKIGPETERVTPQLLEVLRTAETPDSIKYDVRMFVAEVFVQMGYPSTRKAMPTLLDVIARDPNVKVRHRCIWVFLNMDRADFPKIRSGTDRSAEAVLTEVLSDSTLDNALVVRYDAARALAFNLRDQAPEKAVDVLLHMLNNDKLYIYQGTEATVTNIGTESTTGTSRQNERKGGDARFMAAQSLGMMGKKAAKRADVVEALRKAAADTTDKTGRLKNAADQALKDIGG